MAYPPGGNVKSLGLIAPPVLTVTGAISRAAGDFTGNVELTAPTTGRSVGEYVVGIGIGGTVEANGTHQIVEIVDGTHLTIDVTFANAYTTGGVLSVPTRMTVNYTDLVTVPVGGSGKLSLPAHQWILSMLTSNTGRIWVGVEPDMDPITAPAYGVIADRVAGGIVDASMFGGPTNSFDVRNVWLVAEISGEGAYGSFSIH